MAKLRLISDYYDFYDHCFASRHNLTARPFERIAAPGPKGLSKCDAFHLMEGAGLKCPRHGVVTEFTAFGEPRPRQLVVYTNPYSHRGDDKLLVNFLGALARYPLYDCSVYIEPPAGYAATSYRWLVLGAESFWLRYHSTDAGEWRSNCGSEVEITLTSDRARLKDLNFLANNPNRQSAKLADYPLFAIDFVPDYERLWAVDFNPAPQLLHTGLEDVLGPGDVYALIEAYAWARPASGQ
jgi:hypothetical protein